MESVENPRPRVFISAVTADLGSARKVVIEGLRRIGYDFLEQSYDFAPTHYTLVAELERKIRECHAVVHLVGRDYGFAPHEPIARDWPLSYTQHEYYYARDLRIPTYVFYFDESYPFPPVDNEYRVKYPDAERLRPWQQRHRIALRYGEYVYSTIRSEAELRERIRELRLEPLISPPAHAPRRYWLYDLFAFVVLVAAWLALGLPGLERFDIGRAMTLDRSGRIALAVATLPLLLALGDHFWATFRHWRERLMLPQKEIAKLFQLTPRSIRDRREFPGEAHRRFPEWFHDLPVSLGHLAAASGTGKSSLIEGWLLPALAGQANPPDILHLRGGSNPLAKIAKLLGGSIVNPARDIQAPGVLNASDAVNEISAEEVSALLLQRLDDLRTQDRQLVLILDQFEETLILHHDAPQTLAPLADFLRPWAAQRDNALTILLSYRNDDLHRVGSAGIPQPNFQTNAFELGPFPRREAEAFLRDAKLTLTATDLNRVLAEARDHEQGDPDVRPIVANLLGLVLAQLAGARRKWRRVSNLARGYVERALRTARTDERSALILKGLISASGRAQTARLAELAATSGLSQAEVDAFLLRLQPHGIVRLIEDPAKPALRVWAVAHDFLARLVDRALDRYTATVYSRLRPHIHLAVLVLLLLSGAWWVRYEFPRRVQAQRDAAELYLRKNGFQWEPETRGALHSSTKVLMADQFPDVLSAIVVLNPRSLELPEGSAEQDLSFLAKLPALEVLKLSAYQQRLSLKGLDKANQLRHLHLQGDKTLSDIQVLKKCTSLERIWFNLKLIPPSTVSNLSLPYVLKGLAFHGVTHGQNHIADLQWLSGIGSVEELTIWKCRNLRSLNGVASLKGLTSLRIIDSDGFSSIAPAADCPQLKEFIMSDCDVEGVDQGVILQSKSLRILGLDFWESEGFNPAGKKSDLIHLSISRAPYLKDFTSFLGLPVLENLTVGGLEKWNSLKGIEALPRLKKLHLFFSRDAAQLSPRLSDLRGLSGHPTLEEVSIDVAQQLTTIGPLRDVRHLKRLKISDASTLSSIGELSDLPALQEVEIRSCNGLGSLDGLEAASSIKKVTLVSDRNLQDVNALDKINSLETVVVEGMSDAIYVQLRALKGKMPRLKIESDRGVNAVVNNEK